MILFDSAAEAAAALQRRELSAAELAGQLLARIDDLNGPVNAIVELRADEALAEAAQADRRIADGTGRALEGVPITIKEAFDVAGLHTTWGNPAFAQHVAASDATAVQRLRQAGAIVVGKTNVQLMLSDFGQTANDLHGTTVNPWDPVRTPGGSSGGSAAAVAAGISFLDFGSDLVGSIRIPASACGVYGLRPTTGTVPLTGFAPPGAPTGPDEQSYLTSVGPLARSAADLRTALRLTGGPELPNAKAFSWSLAPPRHAQLNRFRIGVVLDHPRAPVSSDVGTVLSDTVDAIANAGATIGEGWPGGIDPIASYESFGHHLRRFFAFHGIPDLGLTADELIAQEQARMAARAAWTRWFAEHDAFICPVNFTAAFAHDDRPLAQRSITTSAGELPYGDQPFWTAHAALAGLPSLSAPAGLTKGGLPVGLQIIGPLHEDDTAVTFAELLAEVAGGYVQPPAIRRTK